MSFTITTSVSKKKYFGEIGMSVDDDNETLSLVYEAVSAVNLAKNGETVTGTVIFTVTDKLSGAKGSYQFQLEYNAGSDPFKEAESQLQEKLSAQ